MHIGCRATKHKLDVRHRDLRASFDECMQPARHDSPWAGAEQPSLDHAGRHAVKPHLAMERTGLGTREREKYSKVVLKIAADRQIDCRFDAGLAQMCGWSD